MIKKANLARCSGCKFLDFTHHKCIPVCTKEEECEKEGSLPISHDRIMHMVGVAEYMCRNAGKYGLPPIRMYLLGLLHDIGYISGEKNNHEWFGANLVERCFGTDFVMPYFGSLIEHHGDIPKEYEKEYGKPPNELILLWEADMMVDLSGEEVGFAKRLEGIEKKYGKNSETYQICSQTINWLNDLQKGT